MPLKNIIWKIYLIILTLSFTACSSLKNSEITYSSKELENFAIQNCNHPIIKEWKNSIAPISVNFIFDNPKVEISKEKEKIFIQYKLKIEAFGVNIQTDTCLFSTKPIIVNEQINLSEHFKLEKLDFIGGPEWIRNILYSPQELLLNSLSGSPYEIIKCISHSLPKNATQVIISSNNKLNIKK